MKCVHTAKIYVNRMVLFSPTLFYHTSFEDPKVAKVSFQDPKVAKVSFQDPKVAKLSLVWFSVLVSIPPLHFASWQCCCYSAYGM